jgi:hypothetical protein
MIRLTTALLALGVCMSSGQSSRSSSVKRIGFAPALTPPPKAPRKSFMAQAE